MTGRSTELTADAPFSQRRAQPHAPLLAVLISLLAHAGLIAGGTLLNDAQRDPWRLEFAEGIPVEVIIDRDGRLSRAGPESRLPDIPLTALTSVPANGATKPQPVTTAEALKASAESVSLRPVESSAVDQAVAHEAPPLAASVRADPPRLAALPAGDDLKPLREPLQSATAPDIPMSSERPVVAPEPSHSVESVQDRTRLFPVEARQDLAGLSPVEPVRIEAAAPPPSIAAEPQLDPPKSLSIAPESREVLRALEAAQPGHRLVAEGKEPEFRDAQPAPLVAAVAPETADVALPQPAGGYAAPLRPVAPVQNPQRSTDLPEPRRAAALPPAQGVQSFDPQKEIETTLSAFECARINARWDPKSGSLAVSGHVRSDADRRKLVETVSPVPGVERVDVSGMRVVGEPYCRLVAFLSRPELNRSEDQRHDMAVLGTAAQAGISHYSAGTVLQLTLAAPEFDSYIYVDYFSSDGRVYHLLPTEKPDNRFKADERVSVGGDHGRGRRAVVGAPFGLDVVVAIASSEALFVRPRPQAEAAADYLAALDARIHQLREIGLNPRLEYAYYLTYTTAGGGSSN